jgi:hypothetical protein
LRVRIFVGHLRDCPDFPSCFGKFLFAVVGNIHKFCCNLFPSFSTFIHSGLVVGLLKIGRKSLYVFDKFGDTKHVNAPCVLDFYIHESRQRGGLGKILFEYMLDNETLLPEQLAIDRPSEKLLGFLRKHYGELQSFFFWSLSRHFYDDYSS